jgi:hypothetical protein
MLLTFTTDPTPLSSLLISDVAYSPYLPVLIKLVVSDWWFSLQPPAHAGSPLADFSSLKMEAIRSSETSVDPRSTQLHIPEDDILQNLCVHFLTMCAEILLYSIATLPTVDLSFHT